MPVFARIRHAGAVFLGRHCPEAVGDYVAGPNHVLPTGRTARFASGLSVFDFLKRTTWVAADADGAGPGRPRRGGARRSRGPARPRAQHRAAARPTARRRARAYALTIRNPALMFRSANQPPNEA